MVSASTSKATANIVIARTGGGSPVQPLVSRLEQAGYNVIQDPASPVGADGRAADLAGVDAVFLIVREAEDLNAIGPYRPVQRVARDAGVLQGRLAPERVHLLVENGVSGLTADLGVNVIRYDRANPEAAFDKIERRLQEINPMAEPGLHNRLNRVQESRAAGLLIPFLLFGSVFVIALFGALLVFAARFGNDDEPDDEPMAQLIDVAESLRTGGSSAGVGSIVAGEDPGGESGAAGPSAGFAEANQLFPAVCELPLTFGEDIPDETRCEGAGVLVRNGSAGPWHNELRLVALSDGVVGEVVYERSASVRIESGVEVLDAGQASFGVETVTLTFSAPGQHVHLRDGADEDAREVTLTLRLDR